MLQNRPVQPREAKADSEAPVVQINPNIAQTADSGAACNAAQEMDNEHAVSVVGTMAKIVSEDSVSDENATCKDKISVDANSKKEGRQALRPEAEEFVPLSPERVKV